jgi:16S rRNA (cytosine967-C5)-methyltransferase
MPTLPESPAGGVRSEGPRAVAARILERWLRTGDFPNRLLEGVTADRPFITEVVMGVARWRRALDWILERRVRHAPDPRIRAVLLAAAYELLFMDDTAVYAAVDGAVEAARQGAKDKRAGFVNAVLRGLVREKDAALAALREQPPAVRWSHPDALMDRWQRRFAPADLAALCEWDNSRPRVAVKINTLAVTRADLLARWTEAGVTPDAWRAEEPDWLLLPRGRGMESLPGFAEGWFAALDPSARLSVALLDPRPGDAVLDACAAPGGKTFLIAERLKGQGAILACDVHDDRLRQLRQTLARLKLQGLRVEPVDWVKHGRLPFEGSRFDRILLDVPCTNTGVLRRRPDARWRFSAGRMAALNRAQRAILDRAANLLMPGGVMVYSTCSLEPEENEDLVAAWLGDHPGFRLDREVRNVPPATGADGAYAARLVQAGAGNPSSCPVSPPR